MDEGIRQMVQLLHAELRNAPELPVFSMAAVLPIVAGPLATQGPAVAYGKLAKLLPAAAVRYFWHTLGPGNHLTDYILSSHAVFNDPCSFCYHTAALCSD